MAPPAKNIRARLLFRKVIAFPFDRSRTESTTLSELSGYCNSEIARAPPLAAGRRTLEGTVQPAFRPATSRPRHHRKWPGNRGAVGPVEGVKPVCPVTFWSGGSAL